MPETELAEQDRPQAIATAPVHTGGGWLSVIDKLIDRGCPVADLQKIFEMQQQYVKEQARLAFKRSFAAFRAECPRLEKDKTVSFTTTRGTTQYKHVLIATAVDSLSPILAAHGLSHRWETRQEDGGLIRVTCHLEHEEGHSESATLSGAADMSGSKNPVQAVASTVTYLQRYTFMSVTGSAAADGDDDGRGGNGNGHEVIDADQLKAIEGLCQHIEDAQGAATAAGAVIERPFTKANFLAWLEVKDIRDMSAKKFKETREFLARKLAVLKGGAK